MFVCLSEKTGEGGKGGKQRDQECERKRYCMSLARVEIDENKQQKKQTNTRVHMK